MRQRTQLICCEHLQKLLLGAVSNEICQPHTCLLPTEMCFFPILAPVASRNRLTYYRVQGQKRVEREIRGSRLIQSETSLSPVGENHSQGFRHRSK